MVLKTTFGQSQRWSLIRGTLGVESDEKNNLNFANKVFNREDVLILGGLNSGISLYFPLWFGMVVILDSAVSLVIIGSAVSLWIYLLESPRRGDTNKYSRHMFLGILNTILFL